MRVHVHVESRDVVTFLTTVCFVDLFPIVVNVYVFFFKKKILQVYFVSVFIDLLTLNHISKKYSKIGH
jgi:hypothetical protein